MALVQLQNIKKGIIDKKLFDIEHVTIYAKDRIGLVGTNGSGKTTLLNVIAKKEEPDEGYVEHRSKVSLLPQLKRTDTTKSGGETTAEYVIQALNKNPAVLLADEPTTHMDAKHIEWIEKEFQAFQGAYIVVSHDREFLDKVCHTIWELKDGELTVYSGNYSQYEREKAKEVSHQQTEYEKYKKKEQQLLEAQRKKEEQAKRATKKKHSVIDSEYNTKGSKPYFEKKSKKLH